MARLTEVGLSVQQTIVKNGRIQIDGAISILLNNTGDSIALLNGGLTIQPKANINFSTPNTDVVINDYLTVHFEGGTGKLEVVSMHVKDKLHSNY